MIYNHSAKYKSSKNTLESRFNFLAEYLWINQLYKIKTAALCLLLVSFIIGCRSKTEVTLDKETQILTNGYKLEVEKTTKKTRSTGILTGHNYGTTRDVRYKILVNKKDVIWEESSAEPKNILFCKDTTYMHLFKKNVHYTTEIDSLGNTKETNHRNVTEEVYQKFIDERYFFKLLGDIYWVNIPAAEYPSKSNCETFPIPNEHFLKLTPQILD